MINDYINIKKTLLSLISIQNILILRLLNLKWPMFIIYMLYKYIKSSSKPFLQYHPSKQIFVNKMLSLHKHHRILFSRFGTLQSFLQLHRRVQKIKCHSVCLKVPFNGEIVIDVIDNVSGRGCCDKKSGRECIDKKSGRECIDRNNDSGLNDGNNNYKLSDKKSGRECIDRNNNNKLNDRIYNDSGLNVVIDNLCRVDENIVCNRENCNKSSTENLYLLEDSTILNENINQVEDTTKLITESTVDNSTIKDSAVDNSITIII